MRTQRFQYGILLVHGNSILSLISCFGGELLFVFVKYFTKFLKRYLQHFINNFMVNGKYFTSLTTLKMGFETSRTKRSKLYLVFGWSIRRQDLGRSQNWMKEFIKSFCLVIFSKEIANFHVQFLAAIWGHNFGLQIPALHICVGARLIDKSTSFNLWQFYNLRIK